MIHQLVLDAETPGQAAGRPSTNANHPTMLSALLMIRRLMVALRIAPREEDFARTLGAADLLIFLGTLSFRLSTDWSVAVHRRSGGDARSRVEKERRRTHERLISR